MECTPFLVCAMCACVCKPHLPTASLYYSRQQSFLWPLCLFLFCCTYQNWSAGHHHNNNANSLRGLYNIIYKALFGSSINIEQIEWDAHPWQQESMPSYFSCFLRLRCWSFRLLPTSHPTQKKGDEFSDVRGCGSRLEHSKLILYICELAFSLFSLSLFSPLFIWYYIFFFFLFFLYILVHDENERTNEKELAVPTIEKYISTPGWQLGQYRWPRNCLSKKKPLALFFSFFLQHRYIYRGKKKKTSKCSIPAQSS